MEWISNQFRFRAIGPLLPSFYLNKRIQEDKDYGISIHNPSTNACLNWLNQQEENSVVYVSFGSVADLGIHQMEEIAEGLKGSSLKYLWVVRESEQAKIPDKFQDETSEKGLVVSWCPQLDVLSHNAVGCFVTHCGWNSTLEALSLGVPMVAMPQWTDQNTNAKFVADVWEMGVVAEANEDGIVGKGAIESCIREVMGIEKRREIIRNASKWRELALEAVGIGGSSDRNIDEFVANLFAASK